MTWTIVDTENGRCQVQREDGATVVNECANEGEALAYVSSLYHYWSLDIPGERELAAAAAPAGANAPYKIVPKGNQFAIVNNAGVVKTTFTDRNKALAYLRALYANVKGAAARAAKVKFTGNAKNRVAEKASMPGTPLHAFINSGVQDLCSVCGLIEDICQSRFALSNATNEAASQRGTTK